MKRRQLVLMVCDHGIVMGERFETVRRREPAARTARSLCRHDGIATVADVAPFGSFQGIRDVDAVEFKPPPGIYDEGCPVWTFERRPIVERPPSTTIAIEMVRRELADWDRRHPGSPVQTKLMQATRELLAELTP